MSVCEADWLDSAPVVVNPGGRPAKGHVGRQRKIHCEACGFIAYASRGALQRSGFPLCGCGEVMQLANLRDRAAVEWDALEAELSSYGRPAYQAAMRELGYTDMLPKRSKYGKGGAGQKRCGWEGGYCSVFSASRYCAEHEVGARAAMTSATRRAA